MLSSNCRRLENEEEDVGGGRRRKVEQYARNNITEPFVSHPTPPKAEKRKKRNQSKNNEIKAEVNRLEAIYKGFGIT